ncbi:MAG: two pore domain potassium channel family protein [Methylococcaceae bacterium]|nr:MAG: two pore domain potassium channel family protein [Methylococcaceae bacterium]
MIQDCTLLKNTLRWTEEVRQDFSKKESLAYILTVAAGATAAFGLLLYLFDPNVHTLADGVWSAWVTMTHVGFGDVVPTSFFGRLLAAALILLGLILFSLFTATLSVAFLGKDMAVLGKELRSVEKESEQVAEEESRILQELARLHQRLDRLELALAARADAKAGES